MQPAPFHHALITPHLREPDRALAMGQVIEPLTIEHFHVVVHDRASAVFDQVVVKGESVALVLHAGVGVLELFAGGGGVDVDGLFLEELLEGDQDLGE